LFGLACPCTWNDGAAANVQGAVADQGSFALLFRSTQSNHISHLQCKDFIVPTSCSTNTPPAVQQSRSTRARRNPSPRMIKVTVHEKRRVNEEQPTPASSPSRNHDSAAPRQHPLICTGAKPIHQVHGQPMSRAPESMLRNRITFPPFSRRFQRCRLKPPESFLSQKFPEPGPGFE